MCYFYNASLQCHRELGPAIGFPTMCCNLNLKVALVCYTTVAKHYNLENKPMGRPSLWVKQERRGFAPQNYFSKACTLEESADVINCVAFAG